MNIYLTIIFICLHVVNCREDYNFNVVDETKGRSNLAIAAISNGSAYSFRLVTDKESSMVVATSIFIEQINSTGWGHLSVTTSDIFSDELQAYYAGVVEGIITRPFIEAQIYNIFPEYCSKPNSFCIKLRNYLSINIKSIIKKSSKQGGYWKMVRLMLWQIKGMQDGYDGLWKQKSTDINEDYLLQLQDQVFGIFLLQLDGDLAALSDILNGTEYHSTFPGRKKIGDGSCSAFIKYINGDIYTAHVTWTSYQMMLRLTKYYSFPYRLNYIEKSSPLITGVNITFSSYPGHIVSLDDYYITSGGLISTETTIGNNNKSLWKPLKDKAASIVLEFIRVQVSNRLAKSGKDWVNFFSMYNSGTYNNQWMIVNTNLMNGHNVGMSIPNEVLYIAEQIPGLIKSHDVTDHLRTSYWSSYNIPYDQEIYNTSGFRELADKYGDLFRIDKSPRALIFKRDAHKVVNGETLMRLMRYNDFKHDPLSQCACKPPYSGENAISARSDLNEVNGTYPIDILGYRLHGGYDVKATNLIFARAMRFVGLSGPTYDQQPVFDWSKIKDPTVRHKLHPVIWNFKPIITPFP